MKDAENDDPLAVDTILENIGSVENLKNDLPRLTSANNRMPKERIAGEQSRFCNDFTGDYAGERGKPLVQESREAVEVGKSICRPFDFHRSDQGRKSGVPQVFSQRSTSA